MTIQERILDSIQKFEQKKREREQHVSAAEECLTEMAKLQGEYRVLKEMEKEETPDPASTVEVVPEAPKKAKAK